MRFVAMVEDVGQRIKVIRNTGKKWVVFRSVFL